VSRIERALSWHDSPWCLNGWPGAEHPHFCRYEYGHDGRCVCDSSGCRSWTLEPPPNAYPLNSGEPACELVEAKEKR
jgi:hypothetical protein